MTRFPMVRVYTRSGDKGTTSLFDGSRVSKADLRVESYGTADELNSALSSARILTPHDDVRTLVRDIQRFLFVLGADLATPHPANDAHEDAGAEGSASNKAAASKVRRVSDDDVAGLERAIDDYWSRLSPTDAFVVPGETQAAAAFHVARTICRRAERLVVRLADADDDALVYVVQYLNRLSDLLFTLGRHEDEGVADADHIRHLGPNEAGS